MVRYPYEVAHDVLPAFAACRAFPRRLAALHALGSKGASSQQPKQQQQQSAQQVWASLTQQQRLHAMAPHGRAPASFLAAAGPVAAEVTQAVQVRVALLQLCLVSERAGGSCSYGCLAHQQMGVE
jgi:hypothetical protein